MDAMAAENMNNGNDRGAKNNRKKRAPNPKRELSSRKQLARSRKPEWRYQLFICILVLLDKLSRRLGSIASIWAMTILLGGFVSGLSSRDFRVISTLVLASSLRLFGSDQEQKLNLRSKRRRHILLRWLFNLVRGRKEFHLSSSTALGGTLDLTMYLLQVSSASVSLAFSVQRLYRHKDFAMETDGSFVARNQRDAMSLYYSMVLIEAIIFLPAKLCWELPRDVFLDKNYLFGLSRDKDCLNKLFDIWDDYFAMVHMAARESTARGLDMSLRSYISDTLLNAETCTRINVAAAMLLLDMLYQRDEWIKRKADAEKRARLVPFVFQYLVDHTGPRQYHESCEAAVSLLISLMVNKTNTPEPSKFGPLVLLRALESGDPKAVEMLGQDPIRGQVIKYLRGCLESQNADEVILAIDVVRRLPPQFHQGIIVEAMIQKALTPKHENVDPKQRTSWSFRLRSILCRPQYHEKHINIPALLLWRLCELGQRNRFSEQEADAIVENLIGNGRSIKLRELEILVGLGNQGLLRTEHKRKVNLRFCFRGSNFMRCLPDIVEWLILLDDRVRRDRIKPHVKALIDLLQSPGRNRPDVLRLCRLLERDATDFVELQPIISEILKPEEEC